MDVTRLLDEVHAQARELRPLRIVLAVIAAPFIAAAFVVGVAVKVSWLLFAWAVAAVKVGYRHGRGVRREGT